MTDQYSLIAKEIGINGVKKLIDNLEANHVDFQLTTKLYRLLALLKDDSTTPYPSYPKINYKNFDPIRHYPRSMEQCINIINMFAWEHGKRECAMSARNEKWCAGLTSVANWLKEYNKYLIDSKR